MFSRLVAGVWSTRFAMARIGRRYPARLTVVVYALVIAVSATLLMLPAAHAEGLKTEPIDAFFTATSAVSVTGLATVDTGTHWSFFGQAVILGSIQIGGFGVLTLASLLGLLVTKRLSLTTTMLAAAETQTKRFGDLRKIILTVVFVSLGIELIIALMLLPRFLEVEESLGRAVWFSVFYSISAFNNAGFSPTSAGLTQFASDWFVLSPIMLAVVVGGLGFPVILNVARTRWNTKRWSIHTKMTLTVTAFLLSIGFVWFLAEEWTNPETLGPMPWPEKVLSSLFLSVMPRTAGFNSIDIGALSESSWLMTDALMFVGGGSASTAGGIKATTLGVLLLAIIAEARGDRDTVSFHRRIPTDILRLAIAVTFLSATIIALATMLLLEITGLTLDVVLFETVSAYATVGLSTGMTAGLPESGKAIIALLMFIGRVGTMTFGAALAVRSGDRLIRLPEERLIVG